MFWTGFAYGFAACLTVGLTARFMQDSAVGIHCESFARTA